MSLRTRLLIAFSISVSLVIAVGLSSYRLNSEIEARVDGLRSRPGADFAGIDVRLHALEMEGFWDSKGYFVAREVDLLPGKRRPKLRGTIDEVDADARTVKLFGTDIHVSSETEFVTEHGSAGEFEELHPGQRVEISARVFKHGRWFARKIKIGEVKSSDQVKGTPRRIAFDRTGGEVDVAGLRVLLPPADEVSAGSALRNLRIATLMAAELQELRSAARAVVGRARSSAEVDTVIEPDGLGEELPIREAISHERRAFGYYLDQLTSSNRGLTEIGEAKDPRLRLLKQQFEELDRQLALLIEFSGRDFERATEYLDDVVEPQIGQTMLPAVYALRGDAEEALSDQIREISSWAKVEVRIAAALSVLAVVVAAILWSLMWRSINGPVRALHEAALSIGSGHLETRVELQTRDELGVLAGAFNQMAEALARTTVSVASLESIFDSIAGILVTLDSESRITNVNRGVLELLGYERDELLGRPFKIMCSGSSDAAMAAALGHAKKGIAAVEEISLVRRDGTAVPVSFSAAEVRAEHGARLGYVCVAQDLSVRKAIEEQVRSSLAQKELLLRELHHRVKNNMQSVSSLLAIQASFSTNPDVGEALEESQRRIQSMALIHDQLHHSTDRGLIDAQGYLTSLVSKLGQSLCEPRNIEIEFDIKQLWLDVDHALACGLIVNELVTNALKHAFDSHAKGRIRVAVWDRDSATRVLEISDDGRGIDSPIEFGRRTLGLTLVVTLVKQLEGRLAMGSGPGAHFSIEFPSNADTAEVRS